MATIHYKSRDELEAQIKELVEVILELEKILIEAIEMPKGIEPHSYSDYKMKKDD